MPFHIRLAPEQNVNFVNFANEISVFKNPFLVKHVEYELFSSLENMNISSTEVNFFSFLTSKNYMSKVIPYNDAVGMIRKDIERMKRVAAATNDIKNRVKFDHIDVNKFKIKKSDLEALIEEINNPKAYLWIQFNLVETPFGSHPTKKKWGKMQLRFTGTINQKDEMPNLKKTLSCGHSGSANSTSFKNRNIEISNAGIAGFDPNDERGGIVHEIEQVKNWLRDSVVGKVIYCHVVTDKAGIYTNVILTEDKNLRNEVMKDEMNNEIKKSTLFKSALALGNDYFDDGQSCCPKS